MIFSQDQMATRPRLIQDLLWPPMTTSSVFREWPGGPYNVATGERLSLWSRWRWWCSSALQTVEALQRSVVTAGGSSSPNPEEDDSLSAKEEESTWSCDRPSISGMESSEDGTEES